MAENNEDESNVQ